MPFDPLPETLSELSRGPAAMTRRAVELGCGDGDLLRRLRRDGLWCAGLDRSGRGLAAAVDVRGDACRPPLRPRSLDLVVAANLARHLLPADPGLSFVDTWLGLLRPGGSLFMLEDEPTAGAATGNHRDLQAFLARVVPGGRGPLVAAESFRSRLSPAQAELCRDGGVGPNAWPQDATAALALLASGRPEPGGEAARLAASIARHGLACGRMWWLQMVVN